jgi:hypothetical protein
MTFGGTILFNPMNTFLYCILGSKVDNLQAGLNWLSIHARVTLPTVPDNILMLSDESMAEIATPIAAAAVGTSDTDDDQGVVGKLIAHFEQALVWERNFYAIMLGVWLGLALIGLIVVLWHSGGRDRYHSWRGTTPSDDDAGQGGRKWPWGNENDQHPIYDNYAEKEFRGITPTGDVPHIVEPGPNSARSPGQNRTSTSFFDYPRGANGDTQRPFVPRKGTFGGSISSLVAPGQAFLKMTGRGISNDGHDRLVEKGETSEKYNIDPEYDEKNDDALESPPPFWVNRFYGGLKSLFPTRGQKHGAALERNGSQRTDPSFGASQMPSAVTPRGDWAEPSGQNQNGNAQWAMNEVPAQGRSTNPFDDQGGSREYPPHPASHPIYPRPLSRAPTPHKGGQLPRTTVIPPLPSKVYERDSVDYLDSEAEFDPYDDINEEKRLPVASPASSSVEYFAAGPVMESVNRVNVGGGRYPSHSASAALEEVISKKRLEQGSGVRYI